MEHSLRVEAVSLDKRHLCALEIGGEVRYLDRDVVARYGIKAGYTCDEAGWERLWLESELTRAKSKALWLLNRRDYAQREMIRKLCADFSEDIAQQAVDILAEGGLLDDAAFAQAYAQELVRAKGLSARAVAYELIHKGIDRELAEEVAGALDIDEGEAIRALIARKYPGCLGDEKGRRRVFAALMRKGYGFEAIRGALEVES